MLSISMESTVNIYFVDSISQAFYSPLSSERGWGRGFLFSLFLSSGVGGEALSSLLKPETAGFRICIALVIPPEIKNSFLEISQSEGLHERTN